MLRALEVAGLPLAHGALDVSRHVTTSLFDNVDEV
jgi:hypothetical protein